MHSHFTPHYCGAKREISLFFLAFEWFSRPAGHDARGVSGCPVPIGGGLASRSAADPRGGNVRDAASGELRGRPSTERGLHHATV
jgi:hypothetical protein